MHSKVRGTAEVEWQLGAWVEPGTLLNYRLPDWQNLRASGIRHFFIECFKHGRLDLRMLDTTRPDYLPRLLCEHLGDRVAVHAWVHTLRWSIDRRSATPAELRSTQPQPLSGPHHLACDLRSYSDLLLTHGTEEHLSWDIERNGGLFADATRLHDGLQLVDSPLLWACERIAANSDIQTIHLDYCRYPNPNIDPLRRHIAYRQQHEEHEKHHRPHNIALLLQALVARFGRARLSATPIAALNLEVGQDCRDFFRLMHFVVPQCYSETDKQVRDFLKCCGDGRMMGGVVHGPLLAHPHGAHAQIARLRRLGDGHAGLMGVCFWKLSPGLVTELAVAGV